ncbi:tumor necrosis factor alpha-induced protein 8-like protein isoform X2 [Planococcus citri]|uniref:tumor necrosis factor alpha-induced protein 8-like protein isoform X2 n=1 Tax=Planococcus citri TaxID=170843 RepID=UPI0031F8C82B
MEMASENFKAKDIGLKAQKKLLGHMSNKTAVKMFIDDRSAAVLDNTYRLFKQYTTSKKEAEKLMKCIIKTIIKIGILYRNNQFNNEEIQIATKLRCNFQKLVMTIASFYELEYSYDHSYLTLIFKDLHNNLTLLVKNHLTEKSLNRINHVFQFCIKKEFSDAIFSKQSSHRETLGKIVSDLNHVIEEDSN